MSSTPELTGSTEPALAKPVSMPVAGAAEASIEVPKAGAVLLLKPPAKGLEPGEAAWKGLAAAADEAAWKTRAGVGAEEMLGNEEAAVLPNRDAGAEEAGAADTEG